MLSIYILEMLNFCKSSTNYPRAISLHRHILYCRHIYERKVKNMAQFTNQAQLRYGNSVTNSNIAVGEILEVLSISKTAVKNTYHPGGTVTYIISIVNSGTTPITGLTLTDDLGAYAFSTTSLTPLTYLDNTVKYYTNGTLQAAPAVTAGPPLVFSGLTVPANGNLTLVYETAVNQYAPLTNESFITNTVTASGDGITSITAKETVNAEALPLLGITKSISPVPVTENGSLTYTFLIQNEGNVPANEATAVIVTDTFNPILSNLTVTFNGSTWTEGEDYTYDKTTGTFATSAGKVTVPAATFTVNETTGEWSSNPGFSTLTITGTV